MSWCAPSRSWLGCMKPIRSQGTTSVPWWRYWKKACWLSVPVAPHTTPPVGPSNGEPSAVTLLPRLSIINCWRKEGNRDRRLLYGITAREPAPRNDRCHTSRRPSMTGPLTAVGVVAKCLSTTRIPSRSSPKASGPMEIISASPTAEASENRPPTHSGTEKIISASIPHRSARFGSPVTATKWRSAKAGPTPLAIQARASEAAARVSAVVNDLEDTITRVEAGSRPRRASTRSAPSRLDENRRSIPGWARSDRAALAMAGPRFEPPTPRASTESMGVPVAPIICPERIRLARDAMRSRFS